MTLAELRRLLAECPLIASVQASEGSPLDDPDTIVRLAKASFQEGVRVLRLQGVENIRAVRAALPGVPTIGLIKRTYPGSEVYITPTATEVDALLALGCEVIALDGTDRDRPGGTKLSDLITRIQAGGALAMADCDESFNAILAARKYGAHLVSTTLSGYTVKTSRSATAPDLELVSTLAHALSGHWEERQTPLVIAEGRYSERWHVHAALQNGAVGVVVGGALNDPVKQTRALSPLRGSNESVAAFDLGGTWLRFTLGGATKSSIRDVAPALQIVRVEIPRTRSDRIAWMRARIEESEAVRAAISTGGTVDPSKGRVWEAKSMIPEHLGTNFNEESLGVPTIALNDGLCAALAHARLPGQAGRRVATLALGTGVGAGMVAQGRLWRGTRGEYPRINDVRLPGGLTIEEALGGAALTPNPSDDAKAKAIEAFRAAVETVRDTMFPEIVYVCGTVGLSPWLRDSFPKFCHPSPFGPDAALYGALSLAEWGE